MGKHTVNKQLILTISEAESLGSDAAYSSSYASSPSPSSVLSNDTIASATNRPPSAGSHDEGIDIDDAFAYFEDKASPRKRKVSFPCAPPPILAIY